MPFAPRSLPHPTRALIAFRSSNTKRSRTSLEATALVAADCKIDYRAVVQRSPGGHAKSFVSMASSGPPEFFNGGHPPQVAPQGGATSQPVAEERGPLSSLNIGFIKTLNDKRKARGMASFAFPSEPCTDFLLRWKDAEAPRSQAGQQACPDETARAQPASPAVRRTPGVSPICNPRGHAVLVPRVVSNLRLTRWNRTHRERKELYIKSLEDEVLRLKESFTHVSQDKDKLAEENNHLKAILRQNGIPYGGMGGSPASASHGYNTTGSVSGTSYLQGSHSASTPPLTSQSLASSMSPNLQVPLSVNSNPSPRTSPAGQQFPSPPTQRPENVHGIDTEQTGIDFVLT